MSDYRHTPDSLAERLDELLSSGQPDQVNQDSDPLIQAAAWMASAPRPQMPSAVMARIQAQVIHAQQTQRSILRPRFPHAARWAFVASIVLIVLFIGSIPPSLASVPGDFLYPYKQAIEQAELTFANSPEASAAIHLTHAERRSQEAVALFTRGQFDSYLIKETLEELSTAAQIAHTLDNLDTSVRDDLERRTIIVSAQLSMMLMLASDSAQTSASTIVPLLTEVYATQNGGGLLLSTPTPTSMPSPTEAPTQTVTIITETPLPTASLTASPSPTEIMTQSPTTTVSPDTTNLPVNLIIEGPIQSINDNIVVIYEFEIELAPDDPLLSIIQVGDVVRIGGNISGNIEETGVVALQADIVSPDVEVNGTGEVWRDTGDCSNPPPSWALAHGWRVRCEGDQQPGNSSGNNNNNGNNGGDGRGMGNDDNDD
jgi:uncharacterized protein DUF5667